MSGAPAQQGDAKRPRPTWRSVALPVITLALLAVMVVGYYAFPADIGPAQPIPFSHRVHAGDKEISCLFCHPGAIQGSTAEVPPLETCMLCHQKIIVNHPQIAELRRHWEQREPVEWVIVENVPDHAYFDHAAHTRIGLDCGECHGHVAAMDRIRTANKFEMGFCVQCHRDEEVSVDCLTCHR